MATETGKERSQRIQIDYYRQRTDLHRFRNLCIAIGLFGALGYAGYVAFAGRGHVSTGPIASVHAAFEDDCQQCHRALTPISSGGSKLSIGLLGIAPETTVAHVESACQACHPVGDHYRDRMNADWQLADRNCAGCHSDHHGRDHDLAAITLQQCVSCHADLASGCAGTPKVRNSIVGFDKETHGDFSSLAIEDPGRIKFDHAQHMMPGQVDADTRGGFTIGQLPPLDRPRYRRDGQQDGDLVTLDCSSCHEMSGVPADGKSLIADGELGRYIQPITFDRHCAACHSLNPDVATAASTPLPHAVPWNQIDLLLAANRSGAQSLGFIRPARDDSQSTPLPGVGLGPASVADSSISQTDLDAARQEVRVKCLQCHDEDSITDEAIANSALPGQELIPSRWLQKGIYDHAAHREIDCRYCHRAAYPQDKVSGEPNDHETVMIAGIESCIWCHRSDELPTPLALTDAVTAKLIDGQPTWASDQCTLCHRYHTPHGTSERHAAAVSLLSPEAASPATLPSATLSSVNRASPPTEEAAR